jgi:hypothetical protein
VKAKCGGHFFRDFISARVSGAYDFGNGLTEPDQPYRENTRMAYESPGTVPPAGPTASSAGGGVMISTGALSGA